MSNLFTSNPAPDESALPPQHWLRYWGPVLAWALVIWIFSTAVFSEAATSRWLFPLLHWLLPNASPRAIGHIHHLIRKFAHVFEYLLFSLLLLHGIRRGRPGWHLSWSLAALGLAVLWAASDEFHQIFVFGRGPSLRDVLIDGSGALTAQLLAAFWFARLRPSAPASQESPRP
ncbi:MAG: VanZ family protein [Acidobacteriia bacterium]|nr:VanZ family protein [Terriglobia bacterium]